MGIEEATEKDLTDIRPGKNTAYGAGARCHGPVDKSWGRRSRGTGL